MRRRDDGNRPAGPLAGLTVIDVTTSFAGPTASMLLADLGADVIKVERPGGDDARSWGPPFVQESSAWFASANRNKRSIVVDLSREVGREVLRRLVAQGDVFLESFNPAKLTDLGIDPETLRAASPRLIYCAMSGFGWDGPHRDLAGYDLAAQARSGIMSVTGPKGGPPQRVSTALSDIVTGMCAALAVCAAVVRQREHGTGDLIDVSLLDTDLAVMAPRIASFLAGAPEPEPCGATDSVLAVYQAFPTADRDIVIAIGNDKLWRKFCAVIGAPQLAEDQELADNSGRRRHQDRVLEAVEKCLVERTAGEWLDVLREAGVPCSLIQSLSEVVADPQVLARRALLPVPDGDGLLHSVHSPFRLASIPQPRNDRFPDLGEHTGEVLREFGFDAAHIAELEAAGVVAGATGMRR